MNSTKVRTAMVGGALVLFALRAMACCDSGDGCGEEVACAVPLIASEDKAVVHEEPTGAGTEATGKGSAIDTAALAALLRAKTALTLLDARSGKYDDGKRISGAKSLNAASTDEEVARTIPAKDALVVTYCAGPKCSASGQLAERLRKDGYKNVIEYPQGIAGWIEAGNAVEQATK